MGITVQVQYLSAIRDITGKSSEFVSLEQDTLGFLLKQLELLYGESFRKIITPGVEGELNCTLLIDNKIVSPSAVGTKLKIGDVVVIMQQI